MSRFSLIVTDTSPLITLALADALDALLRARMPVKVPDAVYVEATRVRTASGASRIVEWLNANLDQVQIVPTEVGVDQQRRLEEGRPTRGLGEIASIEVLDRHLGSSPESTALLLFEDTDLLRRRAVIDDRVGLISTGDLLRELQSAGLIQSADQVLDDAAREGRNVERLRTAASDPEVRVALSAQLRSARDED